MYKYILGMLDWGRKYGNDIYRVCQSFGPPEPFKGPTVDKIQKELTQRIPLNTLDQRWKWRDARLSALAKLKTSMSASDKKDK
jgi:hypothetical protein